VEQDVSDQAVSTDEKPKPEHLFKPGNNANPKGRPKGSRNKLGEAFLSALHADFEEHGVAVIAQVRTEKPDAYLKVVASILPQKLEIEHVDNLTDDERRSRIRDIAEQLGAVVNLGLVAGVGATSGGREAIAGSDEASPVQTLQ
jgi:hypothetical protein